MTTPQQQHAILSAVDAAFDEQLAFTVSLVETPSLRGSEKAAQDLMESRYRTLGLSIDRWTLDPVELALHPAAGAIDVDYSGSEVVVGTYTPDVETGRSLIVNGHVDVVPTGLPELWSRGPFNAVIAEGWLYGRGAADMKAGLAAAPFALAAVQAAGLRPLGRVHLQSVPEEESTGNGTVSTLQHGYHADAVLIPEPVGGELVRAHVGVIWFKVRLAGQAAHAAEMSEGFNAVDAAYALVSDLRRVESQWNQTSKSAKYFEELQHPFNFNVGLINGGDWTSSVPDWCEFSMRIAFPPGRAADDAWAEILQAIEQAAQENPVLGGVRPSVTKTGFYADGYSLEPGSEAEDSFARAFAAASGRPLGTVTSAAYLDARVYGLFDNTPSLVFGPECQRTHGADECVSVESLREVTRAMALFIADWCGVEQR
ncbi:acetylornithine deacetylase [Paenarthrobacter nicotinovorans]|uniref:ArgE/DapE family deacylase n=1 Tax=Micrococcaceae TaxID=1268 RepID=UPI00087717E8|nr:MULTISPECIES: ArgE/DapE family deacylase [Micrococcaceae]MDR6436700.1 acetylornithine deacetylase [Paenarthrobacter nicotinovorans]SCZ56868.1 acetylornithine deacetylase [Arthrobacter sp. UNCCL28]